MDKIKQEYIREICFDISKEIILPKYKNLKDHDIKYKNGTDLVTSVDIAAEKEGYMTGNRVFIYFRNTTELSDWPRVNVSKWPNNPDGLKMTDGIGLLIGAKVYIEDDYRPIKTRVKKLVNKDINVLIFLFLSL